MKKGEKKKNKDDYIIKDDGTILRNESIIHSAKVESMKKKISGSKKREKKNNEDGFIINDDGTIVRKTDEKNNNNLHNVPCCPDCGSVDVTDDGSDYLQYECNACGHIWGDGDDDEIDDDDDAVPCCPECGSDDVTDDGSGYLQYECNDCGHIWGDGDDETDE